MGEFGWPPGHFGWADDFAAGDDQVMEGAAADELQGVANAAYNGRKAPPATPAGRSGQYSRGNRIVLLVNQSVMPSDGKSVYSICLLKITRPLPSSQMRMPV